MWKAHCEAQQLSALSIDSTSVWERRFLSKLLRFISSHAWDFLPQNWTSRLLSAVDDFQPLILIESVRVSSQTSIWREHLALKVHKVKS